MYHAQVREQLVPLLNDKDPQAARWLEKVTTPL